MALRNFTVTIPTPAAPVRLSSALADGLALQNGGKDDISYIHLTFELSSGTKAFIGEDNTVSSTHYAASCTTSKVAEFQGGNMRLGDLWATGTAGDVLQIGAVAL
jgi:hypothetical protein